MQYIRNLAVNLLLFSIVSSVCLAVIEITYRELNSIPLGGGREFHKKSPGRGFDVLFRKSKNDLLLYELVPNAKSTYDRVYNVINSHGMRDDEYPLKKPPKTFRIAVLGDSIIYGMGVDANGTFDKKLERRLNSEASQVNFEVLNFGVPAYSTQQEIELYRTKARHFSPDLIIIGYCLNDQQRYAGGRGFSSFRTEYLPLLEKFYFFDYVDYVVGDMLDIYLDVPVSQIKNKTMVYEDFKLIGEVVSQDGNDAPIVVLIFPYLTDFSDYRYVKQHKRVYEAAVENGLRVVDLLGYYREHDYKSLKAVKHDSLHPNEFGFEIAANATFDLLAENNLVPLS